MKKDNGFTLIELLAVIVILAIIALIATPLILNVIEKAKIGAAKSSALGYMDAVEKQVAINELDSSKNNISDGVYTISALTNDYKVTVKGQAPSEGWISISKGIVTGYSIKIGDYVTNYDSTKSEQEEPKKDGTITTPPSKPIEGTGGSEVVEYTPEECFTIKDNGNGTATITDYLCGKGSENEILDVVIPETIQGLTVINFFGESGSNCSFANKGLMSVVIPDSVTGMEMGAFHSNQITKVVIGKGLTGISNGAFQNNRLTSIEIPDNVKGIGASAFESNQLTSVEIPKSVTNISMRAFQSNSLTSVKIHNTQDKVTLGSTAFGWAEGYSDEDIDWLG